MTDDKAFNRNFEDQLKATLELVEAPGRKVLIVAVFSEKPDPSDPLEQYGGGLSRAVSEVTTRGDARVFLTGLRREVERLERVLEGPAVK